MLILQDPSNSYIVYKPASVMKRELEKFMRKESAEFYVRRKSEDDFSFPPFCSLLLYNLCLLRGVSPYDKSICVEVEIMDTTRNIALENEVLSFRKERKDFEVYFSTLKKENEDPLEYEVRVDLSYKNETGISLIGKDSPPLIFSNIDELQSIGFLVIRSFQKEPDSEILFYDLRDIENISNEEVARFLKFGNELKETSKIEKSFSCGFRYSESMNLYMEIVS